MIAAVALAALTACKSNDDGGADGGPRALCDGTPDGFCPCDTVVNEGRTYLFCPATVAWPEARAHCESFGYDLVRIDDAAEQEFVWSVQGARGGDAWIGLHDRDGEGAWVWSDGTELGGFAHWADEQPDAGEGEVDEDCVEIIAAEAGGWNDRDCAIDYLDYICEAR